MQVTPTDVEADFAPMDIASKQHTSISSLNSVNIEQLVTVKGKVVDSTGIKVITTNRGVKLKKQEITLVDPTGNIKVLLWQNDVETLTVGNTYELANIRLKQNRGERYLNPPKGGECKMKEIPPFEEPLPDVSIIPTTTCKTTVSIIAVQNIRKMVSCSNNNCRKELTVEPQKNITTCTSCKTTQKTNACTVHWLAKLICLLPEKTQKTLTIFHQQLLTLIELYLHGFEITDTTSEEFTMKILSLDQVNLTYNTMTNKVLEVHSA